MIPDTLVKALGKAKACCTMPLMSVWTTRQKCPAEPGAHAVPAGSMHQASLPIQAWQQ